MTAAVRLQLDDVPATVIAQLSHRTADRMTVSRPLPFLRLSGGVRDEEGRAARIESVRVMVENDTPSLEIDLVYERQPFAEAPKLTDTLPGFVPDMPEFDDTVLFTRRDETVSFETERARAAREIVVSDAPPAPPLAPWRVRAVAVLARTLPLFDWLERVLAQARRRVLLATRRRAFLPRGSA